ncbi:phytoene desaturase family protein [Paenibacillus wynnii]|uniref:Capsular biosynthesis protein CpsH n=1 Tax=Paenibacillus wynnii TaxID=268407 RepID=A0A098MCR2_9BACL|nr:phytoene desaturase family protein [Paenibacillus wynnii]KGE20349.1 capsular biosynthesis protein CpsH [Paenibacillus wynnii]
MSRVAIVGSGIGGLTAALLLSKQGQEVTVFERASQVGGRVAFEENGPYRIDRGPTIVLLPEMLLSTLEEGGLPAGSIELLRCNPLYRVHFKSGRTLTKVDGVQEQAAEIEKSFPGEGEGFIRFMKDMSGLFPLGKAAFLERDFKNRKAFFSLKNLSLMARLQAFKSLRSAVGQYFHSEELKDAYSLQSLYIGGAPFRTPGIYTMLPYAEQAFGIWMLKGGYGELPRLMVKELERRGVRIQTRTEVESILVSGGRCRGVFVKGEELPFDAVLYNGDFPHLEGLLPQGVLKKGLTLRAALHQKPSPSGTTQKEEKNQSRVKFKPSSGCLLIYIGANKRWDDSLTHQFFLPDSLNDSLKDLFDHHSIPDKPSYYVFNPVALDDSAAPAGESVLYFLIPVPNKGLIDWDAVANPLADKVLADAEARGFPGLAGSTIWRKVRTPVDAEREGMYGGGSFGIAPVLSQSGVFRPQPKPYNIGGLYAAGASVHPGGGVPIVMQGARLAVHELMKEMRTHDRTDVVEM